MLKSILILLICTVMMVGVVQGQDAHTYSGYLGANSDHQEYPVALRAGDALLITATAQADDNLDTILTLYDPHDQVIASNDDADLLTYDSQIAMMVPETGVYRVEVARYDSSTSGHYDLAITAGTTRIFDYDVPLTGTPQTQDSGHFRIHYTTTGADAVTLDFLAAAKQAFEDAWYTEIDQLGWSAPPGDDLMGGNNLYDVYITDLIGSGEEALGYTQSAAVIGDNPNSPGITEEYASTSYIAIDNDFHDLEYSAGQDAITLLRATAAHEFHHAIQDGLDALEPDDWLHEATSSWMETVAAGKSQDATGYVALAYEYPELCLGTTAYDGDLMYGEWTFMQFLTDEFGADAVRQFWQQLVVDDGFVGLANFLAQHNTDVAHEVARYRLKNLARDYQLAPKFDATVWLEGTINHVGGWTTPGEGVQELGANYVEFAAPPGVYDVTLSGDDKQLELWAIGLTDTDLEAISLGRGGRIDSSGYRKLYLMIFNPEIATNLDNCTSVSYGIKVLPGSGALTPVDSVWNSRYFEALK